MYQLIDIRMNSLSFEAVSPNEIFDFCAVVTIVILNHFRKVLFKNMMDYQNDITVHMITTIRKLLILRGVKKDPYQVPHLKVTNCTMVHVYKGSHNKTNFDFKPYCLRTMGPKILTNVLEFIYDRVIIHLYRETYNLDEKIIFEDCINHISNIPKYLKTILPHIPVTNRYNEMDSENHIVDLSVGIQVLRENK